MKKSIIAMALLVVMLLSVAVSAETVELPEEIPATSIPVALADAILNIDGMDKLTVTSSLSSENNADTGLLFDGNADTACAFDFTGKENKTFSLYTASRVPEALSSLGVIFDLNGSKIKIGIYATNDSLRREWKHLTISIEPDTNGRFTIINIMDASEKYAFYRMDITLVSGETFAINEVRFLKPHSDEPEMEYDIGSVVEEGETPALKPIEDKKDVNKEDKEDEEVLIPNNFYAWFMSPSYSHRNFPPVVQPPIVGPVA